MAASLSHLATDAPHHHRRPTPDRTDDVARRSLDRTMRTQDVLSHETDDAEEGGEREEPDAQEETVAHRGQHRPGGEQGGHYTEDDRGCEDAVQQAERLEGMAG